MAGAPLQAFWDVKCELVCQSVTWRVCVSSGDELLLTEMIFNGLFNDLTVEQATALLSCFVFQENVSARARARTPPRSL